MEQSVVEHTDDLPENARIGHNVVEGLMLLRAPVSLFGLKNLRMTTAHDRPPQQEVSATDFHQALRYGIPLTKVDESAAEISKILSWLEGKFNEL